MICAHCGLLGHTLTNCTKILTNFCKKCFHLNPTLTENKLLKLHPSIFLPAPIMMNRLQQRLINRMRAGQTRLTHECKITSSESPSCKLCGEALTVTHIFKCGSQLAVDSITDNLIDEDYGELLFSPDYESLQHILYYLSKIWGIYARFKLFEALQKWFFKIFALIKIERSMVPSSFPKRGTP